MHIFTKAITKLIFERQLLITSDVPDRLQLRPFLALIRPLVNGPLPLSGHERERGTVPIPSLQFCILRLLDFDRLRQLWRFSPPGLTKSDNRYSVVVISSYPQFFFVSTSGLHPEMIIVSMKSAKIQTIVAQLKGVKIRDQFDQDSTKVWPRC